MCLPVYTLEQSYEILKMRAEKSLTDSSFTDDVLKTIAERTRGNMTLALNLLRTAALKAEAEGRTRIELEDIDMPLQISEPTIKLNEDELLLYKIIKEKERISSRQLYTLYKEHAGRSKGERSFRNYMRSLCFKGLVRAIGEKKGRTYEIVRINEEI